ncbi:helix-turn-helix domain-containing protein [Candidatus Bathyarchaeota archaeon]|jgi:predicted DNA binding protein|nr:helix-turn-helix domain-containing protein [Candidatus Bathyarchaeota archaeon]
MFEVSFRARHECPYVQFSMKHPEVRILEWCNYRIDVLEIACPDIETFSSIGADLQNLLSWKGGKVLRKSFFERNLQVIVKTCRDSKIKTSISGVVEENSCFEIPPTVYHNGWEERRIIGFRESDYKKLFRALNDLGPVEILQKKAIAERSIRDTFTISLNSVFATLTDKQLDALEAAVEYGYYQVPKKTTTEEIARKHKVPRTTYEEHVRKAESKIFRAMAPYIRLYASTPQRLGRLAPEIAAK